MFRTTGLCYYKACPVRLEPYRKVMKVACYQEMCSKCVGECPWRSGAWFSSYGSRLLQICFKSADIAVCNRRAVRMQTVEFLRDATMTPIALLSKSLGQLKRYN